MALLRRLGLLYGRDGEAAGLVAGDQGHQIAHRVELFIGGESTLGDDQSHGFAREEEEEIAGFFAFDEGGPLIVVAADGVGENDAGGGNVNGLMAVKIGAVEPMARQGFGMVVGGHRTDVDQEHEPDGMGEEGLPGEDSGVGGGIEFAVEPMLEDERGDEKDESRERNCLAGGEPGETAGTEAGGETHGQPGESEGDDGDPHIDPGHLAVGVAGLLPEEAGDGVVEAEDQDQNDDLPGAVDGPAGGGDGIGQLGIVLDGVLVLDGQGMPLMDASLGDIRPMRGRA